MSNPQTSPIDRKSATRSHRRRPSGVSRRQKKKHLGFEPLEDRRVMSVNSLLEGEFVSFSSATPEGAEQILLRELQRYYQHGGSAGSAVVATAIPTDPLVDSQWHLINTGQQVGNPDFQNIFGVAGEDINVAPVYNTTGLTGNGVVVAVVDSALQVTHPDLAGNVSTTLGLNTFTDETGPGAVGASDHGTAVGGIIGAIANNGLGGSGVAPEVTLVPIEFLSAGGFGNIEADALIDVFRYETDQIDITNNSWGPGVVRGLAGPSFLETLALRDSIFFGRPDANGDALGVIHVFAAGNSGQGEDTASYNGWVNSRYTIGVTGIDHDGRNDNVDGTNTSYPETSASVLVAAPTGSNVLGIVEDTFPGLIGSGIVTTDLVGDFGYNLAPDPLTGEEPNRDFLPDLDFTSTFNGTSAATPMVSGVIALMLEANPNLSWRDVQEILVRSARQNSEFATQADGFDKSVGVDYQNTWIINQVPLFHDPDDYDPLINNALQILNPTLDPALTLGTGTVIGSGIHYAPTPQTLTNGAGYAISQGRGTNRENTGTAHGVVDAELAVLLSQQWNTKDQQLPDELTFTTAFNGSFNLPAAEVVNDIFGPNTDDLVVPGGLGGGSGFSGYWAEFLTADPFASNPTFPNRGLPLEFTVTSPNDMTIETIELTVDITGSMTEFLDNVRVILVSPNGTHTELNHYFVDPSFDNQGENHQVALNVVNGGILNLNGLDAVTDDIDFFDAGSVDTGITNFTFSTNRNWGERSDDAIIFDPSTAEPAAALNGNYFNAIPGSAGNLATQGWQLYMENYSPANLIVNAIELAWHGSPIEANTERVQGLIGIDDNQDDVFNFSRVIQQINQIDLDPQLRLGEIQNLIDPGHESMAANVTVFAHSDVNSNGILDGADILVDQFVTGADGNYYFDLVPGDYIFSLDQSSLLGLTALDDSLTASGFLQDYQAEWAITEDYFQVWDYDANLEVPLDSNGAPLPFLDAFGAPVTYGMQHINFLLDPGTPPVQEVNFSGTVFADFNGDGIMNGNDVEVPGVGIFGDVNRNGELDAGEILTTTDADGNYLLTVPATVTTVMNVGVRPPANWTPSDPTTGFEAFFVQPGDVFSGVDFNLQPPSTTTNGDGSALSGIILGTVFNDSNQDTVRQAGEVGVPRQTVYIDMNNSGALDAGDVQTRTNSNGAYAFANLPDGNHIIRVDIAPSSFLTQTFPVFDLPQQVAVVTGGTIVDVNFGLSTGTSGGALDFGDLPDIYGTRLVDDGARHPEGIFYLGSTIDAEPDGLPAANALGDDAMFIPDEDGVTLASGLLVPNSTGTVTVTASRHSGFLQAWMDFDNNGSFEASEQVIVNELLDAGANTVTFDIPAIVGSTVYARFRFGEYGLGSTGLAVIGEVEDYSFAVAVPSPGSEPTNPNGADFDADGDIDGSDFLALQRGFSMTNPQPSDGDANDDGVVDADDLTIFMHSYGNGNPVAAAATVATADFDSDGNADGSDFLSIQLGIGTPALLSLGHGDTNADGAVDSSDIELWAAAYGHNTGLPTGTNQHAVAGLGSLQGGLSSASELAPRIIQPGFREEFPSAVFDTSESSPLLDSQSLASVAGELGRFDSADNVPRGNTSRLELRRQDYAPLADTNNVTLGMALKDRVLESIPAHTGKSLEELDEDQLEKTSFEDALAAALAEELDWRL